MLEYVKSQMQLMFLANVPMHTTFIISARA